MERVQEDGLRMQQVTMWVDRGGKVGKNLEKKRGECDTQGGCKKREKERTTDIKYYSRAASERPGPLTQ